MALDNRMSSRERVLTALRCEEPDRVPFLEAWVGERIGLALLGRPGPQEGQAAEAENGDGAVGGGAVYIGTRPIASPHYEPIEVVQTLQLDGFGVSLALQGVRQDVHGHYVVAGQQVRTRADLARVRLPDPNDPALYEPFRRFIAQYRHTGLALFCRVSPGASALIFGLGLERFALALYDDRSMIEDIFGMYSDWYARAMRNLCALDFDFIWSGEDIAHKTGPFISPRMFRELFVPNYRRVAEQITKPWIFHSDGNLLPILDDLVDLGLNGIHPVEPKVMDLADLKRRYGSRLCFCGRIEVETLSQGTPQQIERLVQEAIRIAAPGGGYIAGSSNSITDYCRPENVRAMQRAILAHGRYPM
jgi:uroporphyrinogen decarboxylase